MNKTFTIGAKLLVAGICLGLVVTRGQFESASEKVREAKGGQASEKNEKEEITAAAKYILAMKANPLTGSVDLSDILRARQQADQNALNRTATSTTMNWQERGPDNVGGRTRSLVFDNANPNRMYTGSVAGGIWTSNNAGETWTKYNDFMENLAVSCMAQAQNGDLYVGTGEGFYWDGLPVGNGVAGIIGAGIFKSTDRGATFSRLPSTWTSAADQAAFCLVYEVATSPSNPNRIYAGTRTGLRVSDDAGLTWINPITGTDRTKPCIDVAVDVNGHVFARLGTGLYRSVDGSDGSYSKVAGFPSTGYRVEIAISKSNPDYVYATAASGSLFGIFQSTDNGLTWTSIAPAGGSFQPFAAQGDYDNTIAVDPSNPGRIFIAGLDVYTWSVSTGWLQLSFWTYSFNGGQHPYYVHADNHVIRFHPSDPSICYFTNDGGIFRSTNMQLDLPTFKMMNKNYNVTQFYSVGYSKDGSIVLGGAQDNGTQLIGLAGNTPQSAIQINGGDGGYVDLGFINPTAYFLATPNGDIRRGTGAGSNPSDFFDTHTTGKSGSFVTPFRLWESVDDQLSVDSIAFIADSVIQQIGIGNGIIREYQSSLNPDQASAQIVPGSVIIKCGSASIAVSAAGDFTGDVDASATNTIDLTPGAASIHFSFANGAASTIPIKIIYDVKYLAGSKITVKSSNNNSPFDVVLASDMNPHDTIVVQEKVQAKFVAGLGDGVYITKDPLKFAQSGKWFRIHGTGASQTMEWSNDGNYVFIGTTSGTLLRVGNIASIPSKRDTSGTNWDLSSGTLLTRATIGTFANHIITGIAVNPYNANNVVVTLGGYDAGPHVYRSIDALSANPTFTSIQGSGATKLPEMPVYSAVIDLTNPDRIIVGTEMGIWASEDKGLTWNEQNNGMARVPTFMVRQQTKAPWWATNTGVLYAATHGRGLFSCNSFYVPASVKNEDLVSKATAKSGLNVYPNPTSDAAKLTFNLDNNKKLSIAIYSIQGKLVKTQVVNGLKGANTIELDAHDLVSGTYLVSLKGEGVSVSTRFVVTK